MESDTIVEDVFISHAHYDHARGFEFPIQKKYSTKETREIYERDNRRKVGNWQEVRAGRRLKLGAVEVEAHNAGHVLGGVQYEAITPEETVVYASHLNFEDTLLLRAADVAPCDLLVLEAPYASASAPASREAVIAEIVKWALECVRERRVPTFQTDPIGSAQELVRAFNTWTKMPVIVHPRIARVNQVYEENGRHLEYFDASTEEAGKIVDASECAVIVPTRFDSSRYGNFRAAYVSRSLPKAVEGQVVHFPLNDQATVSQLLEYVEEARPKSVLVFHGSSNLLAQMVEKRFKIPARQLEAKLPPRKSPAGKLDESRLGRCEELLRKIIETPNYTYEKRDLMALAIREGYRGEEVEEVLARMTGRGAVRYVDVVDGYALP